MDYDPELWRMPADRINEQEREMTEDTKTNIIVWTMLILSFGGMPLGILLALYYDDPMYLLITAFAFCIMYAG